MVEPNGSKMGFANGSLFHHLDYLIIRQCTYYQSVHLQATKRPSLKNHAQNMFEKMKNHTKHMFEKTISMHWKSFETKCEI